MLIISKHIIDKNSIFYLTFTVRDNSIPRYGCGHIRANGSVESESACSYRPVPHRLKHGLGAHHVSFHLVFVEARVQLYKKILVSFFYTFAKPVSLTNCCLCNAHTNDMSTNNSSYYSLVDKLSKGIRIIKIRLIDSDMT